MRVFENGNDEKNGIVKIAYLSVMNRDGVIIGKAMAEADVPAHIRITCTDSETIDGDERSFVSFMNAVKESDVFFIKLHGDHSWYKKFDRMMKIVEKKDINMLYYGSLPETDAEYRHHFKHDETDYRLVRSFLGLGGKTNMDSLAKWACSKILGISLTVPDPVLGRTDGIYVHGAEEYPEPEEFFKTLDDEKPTVGIMFHTSSLMKNKVAPIDDLVASVERQGPTLSQCFCLLSQRNHRQHRCGKIH